jgi:hypothetical protein
MPWCDPFCVPVGFAGADYDLQDALTESTDKKATTREVDGQTFYDYELAGPVSLPCGALPRHALGNAQT